MLGKMYECLIDEFGIWNFFQTGTEYFYEFRVLKAAHGWHVSVI